MKSFVPHINLIPAWVGLLLGFVSGMVMDLVERIYNVDETAERRHQIKRRLRYSPNSGRRAEPVAELIAA